MEPLFSIAKKACEYRMDLRICIKGVDQICILHYSICCVYINW